MECVSQLSVTRTNNPRKLTYEEERLIWDVTGFCLWLVNVLFFREFVAKQISVHVVETRK